MYTKHDLQVSKLNEFNIKDFCKNTHMSHTQLLAQTHTLTFTRAFLAAKKVNLAHREMDGERKSNKILKINKAIKIREKSHTTQWRSCITGYAWGHLGHGTQKSRKFTEHLENKIRRVSNA
jgi:hypothetical protein